MRIPVVFGRGRMHPKAFRCFLFGDSHNALYAGVPNVVAVHIGPVTMHRVGRDGVLLFAFEHFQVRDGDALAFVFGEIDVRVHIALQVGAGRSEQAVVDALVDGYFRTLLAIRSRFPNSPITVVSASPPSGFDYPSFDAAYPRNGSDEDRVRWARALNALLERRAHEARFHFVDQYRPFANKMGLLDIAATDDSVHIRPSLVDRVDTTRLFG